MSATFKDHFSGHARDYASARPTYPAELFDFLAGLAPARERAWDCATGNGQAARELARHFDEVIATDASEQQVAAAAAHPGVTYRTAAAESPGLDDRSIDLVTVAQALHWFDVPRFFDAVTRVLRPRGVLAAWCYGTCEVEPACDRLIHGLYDALNPWWPPERAIVESGYRDIELPFPLVDAPRFLMRLSWRADDMLAYVATWSATQRCRVDTGKDPLVTIAEPLRKAWGSGRREVRWPIHLKAGRAP